MAANHPEQTFETSAFREQTQEVPGGVRPLKGGFAVACGDALRAPLTGRPPPGWGSASGLSRIRRVPRLRLNREGLFFEADAHAAARACLVCIKEHDASVFKRPAHSFDICLSATAGT